MSSAPRNDEGGKSSRLSSNMTGRDFKKFIPQGAASTLVAQRKLSQDKLNTGFVSIRDLNRPTHTGHVAPFRHISPETRMNQVSTSITGGKEASLKSSFLNGGQTSHMREFRHTTPLLNAAKTFIPSTNHNNKQLKRYPYLMGKQQGTTTLAKYLQD